MKTSTRAELDRRVFTEHLAGILDSVHKSSKEEDGGRGSDNDVYYGSHRGSKIGEKKELISPPVSFIKHGLSPYRHHLLPNCGHSGARTLQLSRAADYSNIWCDVDT